MRTQSAPFAPHLHGSHHLGGSDHQTPSKSVRARSCHDFGLAVFPARSPLNGLFSYHLCGTRCAYLDPCRADRLRNPVIRLYCRAPLWAYVRGDPGRSASVCRADRVLRLPGTLARGPSRPRWIGRSLHGGALFALGAPRREATVSSRLAHWWLDVSGTRHDRSRTRSQARATTWVRPAGGPVR